MIRDVVEFSRAALLFPGELVKIPVSLVRKGKQNYDHTPLSLRRLYRIWIWLLVAVGISLPATLSTTIFAICNRSSKGNAWKSLIMLSLSSYPRK
jgi:hypothetical protein